MRIHIKFKTSAIIIIIMDPERTHPVYHYQSQRMHFNRHEILYNVHEWRRIFFVFSWGRKVSLTFSLLFEVIMIKLLHTTLYLYRVHLWLMITQRAQWLFQTWFFIIKRVWHFFSLSLPKVIRENNTFPLKTRQIILCVYKCVGDKIVNQAIFKQQPIEGIYNNNRKIPKQWK